MGSTFTDKHMEPKAQASNITGILMNHLNTSNGETHVSNNHVASIGHIQQVVNSPSLRSPLDKQAHDQHLSFFKLPYLIISGHHI